MFNKFFGSKVFSVLNSVLMITLFLVGICIYIDMYQINQERREMYIKDLQERQEMYIKEHNEYMNFLEEKKRLHKRVDDVIKKIEGEFEGKDLLNEVKEV